MNVVVSPSFLSTGEVLWKSPSHTTNLLWRRPTKDLLASGNVTKKLEGGKEKRKADDSQIWATVKASVGFGLKVGHWLVIGPVLGNSYPILGPIRAPCRAAQASSGSPRPGQVCTATWSGTLTKCSVRNPCKVRFESGNGIWCGHSHP
jgi:hypothetical protein